jgi:hypothetical protein
MVEDHRTKGPFIRWLDYGVEGWSPDSFPTLRAAIDADSYGRPIIITRRVEYDVIEWKPGE